MRLALIWAACAATAVSAVWTGQAWAQQGPPPTWPALIRCAQMTDPVDELSCYRSAMRAAGYAPNAEAASAEKHRRFGLPKPSINFLKQAPNKEQQAKAAAPVAAAAAPAPAAAAPAPGLGQAQVQAEPQAPPAAPQPAPAQENEDLASFQIAQVAVIPPANRLLIVTVDGAIWEQTDSLSVAPFPKKGGTLQIRRTRFGGYFCRFDRNNSVRCVRTH